MVMLMREGPIFTRGNTTAYLHDESFAILLSIEYYCVDAHLRIMQATESRPSSRQRIGAVEATHDGVYLYGIYSFVWEQKLSLVQSNSNLAR